MKIIITFSLTPEQQEYWLKFWESTHHSHPRQHYAMGQIEIANGILKSLSIIKEQSEVNKWTEPRNKLPGQLKIVS